MKTLDLICLGRAAVDLFAEQRGTALEDAHSFRKYLGGSSGNTAFGASRQGLRVAMLTRVGSDHLGRFVVSQLQYAGVDTSLVQIDETRLTGLVVLGMRDQETFPLIFYRKDCADMAIEPTFTEQQIAAARVLAVTGTHLSTPAMREVTLLAMKYARKNGVKVVLDIDYRPVLWGIGKPEAGESRFEASQVVTASLQQVFGLCDVLVGTEEELHIGGGSTDTLEALKAARAVSPATIVLKRGPLGCQVFEQDIPDKLQDVALYGAARVEVLNVLGAGDAFMSGLLRGYIKKKNALFKDSNGIGKNGQVGEESRDFSDPAQRKVDWRRAVNFANACGAVVVSRHACAPAIPTKVELDYYIKNRNKISRPDKDAYLKHLHRASTRANEWKRLAILAFDHRIQFVEMVKKGLPKTIDRVGKGEKIASDFLSQCLANKPAGEHRYLLIKHLKSLIFSAFETAVEANGYRGNVGILCDDVFAQEVLARATGKGYWIASPVEMPKETPLAFQYRDVGLAMRRWAKEIAVKCLLFVGNNSKAETQAIDEKLLQLWYAACEDGRDLLLEVIVEENAEVDQQFLPSEIERIYRLGIRPDWWKVTLESKQQWKALTTVVKRYDPYCRGVLLLGLDGSIEQVQERLDIARDQRLCKGFAVGRSFFAPACKQWLAGELSDEQCANDISQRYEKLANTWLYE